MTISAATLSHWVGVNGRYVSPEFRVLSSCPIHRKMSFKHLAGVALAPFDGFAKCAKHKLGVRRMEVLAKPLDEMNQILFVSTRQRFATRVALALPKKESCYFVLRSTWIVLPKISQSSLCIRRVIVVLLAGIPTNRLRFFALLPSLG